MDRALLPILREIGDLKRVTSAGRQGSIATRAFAVAWDDLLRGRAATDVALDTTAACLVATRLGDLDDENLPGLGVPISEVAAIRRGALMDSAKHIIGTDLIDTLAARCGGLSSLSEQMGAAPFVMSLIQQPRAGATCPGKPRIILGPPENHAEHCLVVAVYGIILAEPGTDLGTTFLAALAHHFHNAFMPDSGYAGETLLGPHLGKAVTNATQAVLAQLPETLAAQVVTARQILADVETREGRAFHAADVIDRVLEIDQHLARSRVTMNDVLSDMALVHEGPTKPFHDSVLAAMGLA